LRQHTGIARREGRPQFGRRRGLAQPLRQLSQGLIAVGVVHLFSELGIRLRFSEKLAIAALSAAMIDSSSVCSISTASSFFASLFILFVLIVLIEFGLRFLLRPQTYNATRESGFLTCEQLFLISLVLSSTQD
jgi:hypothetical protein